MSAVAQEKAAANDAQNDVKGGKWVRKAAAFRERVTADGSSGFKAEAGRYVIVAAHGCPWSSGTIIALHLKGLQNVIDCKAMHYERTSETGWKMCKPGEEAEWPEHMHKQLKGLPNGCTCCRELYEQAEPGYSGRWTLPVLWDKQGRDGKGVIVNNESIEIIRMLDKEFGQWANNDYDLFPADLEGTDDWKRVFDVLYNKVNDGPYRAGFAPTQEAYDEAVETIFEGLDFFEERLSRKRWVFGDRLTVADLRLGSTCIRFDLVYYIHFKCSKKHLYEYPNLHEFMLEFYQLCKSNIPLNVVKKTYYSNHQTVDPKRILPLANESVDYDRPHKRDQQVPIAKTFVAATPATSYYAVQAAPLAPQAQWGMPVGMFMAPPAPMGWGTRF